MNHSGQLPSVTITFNLRAERVARRGDGRDAATRDAECCRAAITTSFSRHCAGVSVDAGGSARAHRARRLRDLLVLGVLYESFVHPITILSGLPFAALGALLAL